MRLPNYAINLCLIPFICILPVFGLAACTGEQAANAAAYTVETIGQSVADLPENVRVAAPYMQEDLEKLWYSVSGTIEVAAQDIGVSEPPHMLARAQQCREKLISGASFAEVAAKVMSQVTPEDLQNIPSSDLGVLNGILPFEIDLESCGESLAEVLNSLDVGQVSAVLKSEVGYHLIQLIDREGGRVKIGHLVFEVVPATAVADQPPPPTAEEPDPLQQALLKLARALNDQ